MVDKRKRQVTHKLDCKSWCLNLLYFCSVFSLFIGDVKSAWGERFIASITAFTEQPLLCCTHLHFEKCAIRIGPTGKRTAHQPKCQLYLSSVELENNSNVIDCDGDDDGDDGGQSKCSGCASLVGNDLQVRVVLPNMLNDLFISQTSRDWDVLIHVIRIQGYFWTSEHGKVAFSCTSDYKIEALI